MHKSWLLVSVAIGLTTAVASPQPSRAATPRAADLLRAERLAERAKERLRLPGKKTPGWRHGGSGWGANDAPSPAGRDPVTINVSPPRRRTQDP